MSALGRSIVLVASLSEAVLKSLKQVIDVLTAGHDQFDYECRKAFVVYGPESVAAKLATLATEELRRTVCVLDLSSEPTPIWRLLFDNHSLRPTWLAMRFPEVYWIFVVRDGGVPNLIAADAKRIHFLTVMDMPMLRQMLFRHASGFRTWFDIAGLRVSSRLPESNIGTVIDTQVQGLVLDDELAFAAFNSYLLYRRGMRTWMINTATEYSLVKDLGESGRDYVVLEDIELNFEDLEERGPSGKEVGDDNLFLPRTDRVSEALSRRLGAWGVGDSGRIAARVIVSSSRIDGYAGVIKPFSGLYEKGILGRLPHIPPLPIGDANEAASAGHSAPGIYQAIAAALLGRSRVLQEGANDTVNAVHGALLALEAERLLGDKTYAMAVEALTTRHALEAIAESAFAGAADDLEVRGRVDDLRVSMRRLVYHHGSRRDIVESLLPWRNGSWDNWRKLHKRRSQFVNGMLESVGQLTETYRRYSKLDEEELALREVRELRLSAFLVRRTVAQGVGSLYSKWRNGKISNLLIGASGLVEGVVRFAWGIPWGYINLVLNPLFLVLAIVTWILIFALNFQMLDVSGLISGACNLHFADWLRHSAVTFVALQQGLIGEPRLSGTTDCLATANGYAMFWNLTVSEMIFGYVHLALLVTVLIQKFARR